MDTWTLTIHPIRYISRSKELALDYFDVIKEATWDEGLSVRKRSVKVLWECCILCPGFPPQRQVEAVVLILNRAGDSEDSMRKLAASLCTELWFNPGSVLGEPYDMTHCPFTLPLTPFHLQLRNFLAQALQRPLAAMWTDLSGPGLVSLLKFVH